MEKLENVPSVPRFPSNQSPPLEATEDHIKDEEQDNNSCNRQVARPARSQARLGQPSGKGIVHVKDIRTRNKHQEPKWCGPRHEEEGCDKSEDHPAVKEKVLFPCRRVTNGILLS
jgi:hypothetical protein